MKVLSPVPECEGPGRPALAIAASIIAAVRLTREPDASGPSTRIVSIVSGSVRLARMILDRGVH